METKGFPWQGAAICAGLVVTLPMLFLCLPDIIRALPDLIRALNGH